MYQLYIQLRSLLRGHERRLAEYAAVTTALFAISLGVIYAYVDRVGLDARVARGATSATMALLVFTAMLAIWRDRRVALVPSLGRSFFQRVVMSAIPHGLYLTLVGLLGFSYLQTQLGIALIWGLCIAFPVNYLIYHKWSLKKTDKA
jgi:Sec-independent protein secretion pathway component TatC